MAAGLAPVAGAQPTLAPNERGDLALVLYYTVRGEWVTGLHIVNTSARTQKQHLIYCGGLDMTP